MINLNSSSAKENFGISGVYTPSVYLANLVIIKVRISTTSGRIVDIL